jgi:CoA:oxalate CoA-transferase
MNKLGFGYEDLAKINPKLIYCAASGFGHTGPYSSRPAYDLIIQGMGGLMSITGPNAQHPTKVGSSIADIFAGVFACIGILGALHNRDKTGKGQMIDVAMLDCMVAILENAVARFTSTDVDPEPIGNRHPSISPFTSLQTSDGFINVACGNDLLWKKFCEVVGLPELAQDERFSTNALRCENFDALVELVSKPVEQNTSEYWLEKLQKAHVPAGPINKISEVLADPQVLARNMLVELMHPVAGKIKVPGTPIKFSDSTALIDHPAPTLGQHNDEILMQAGYSSREIQDFKEQSVI